MDRRELRFRMKADLIMNRGVHNRTIKDAIKSIITPDYIIQYLKLMRKIEYYHSRRGPAATVLKYLCRCRYKALGIKLGFSISPFVFDYGLVIPHYGTIVVGDGNKVGKYSVLHTSTCITSGEKIIGDALYLSSGAKILNDIEMGNNISVGANAVVNTSFVDDDSLVVGVPASIVKKTIPWYSRDGEEYFNRVVECERLKEQYLV